MLTVKNAMASQQEISAEPWPAGFADSLGDSSGDLLANPLSQHVILDNDVEKTSDRELQTG